MGGTWLAPLRNPRGTNTPTHLHKHIHVSNRPVDNAPTLGPDLPPEHSDLPATDPRRPLPSPTVKSTHTGRPTPTDSRGSRPAGGARAGISGEDRTSMAREKSAPGTRKDLPPGARDRLVTRDGDFGVVHPSRARLMQQEVSQEEEDDDDEEEDDYDYDDYGMSA